MIAATQIDQPEKFAFSSSVSADVWHRQKDAKAYEWWYFDALSDDGNEAVVVVFLDNFIYSPRYNEQETDPGGRFPAISFTYFRDGKPLYRTVNEFHSHEFSASEESPQCRIGNSYFRHESASYGSGYTVSIDASLSKGRRLEASFEWLSIESDFAPDSFSFKPNSHSWNMAAPRCDVTGKIVVYDRKGNESDTRQFRGTGYHDHNLDNRWLANTVRDWHWGRVHFGDCTAIFYRYCEIGDDSPSTKLFVIQDGELTARNVEYDEQNYVRDKFGIRYPTRLRLIAEDDIRLSVNPLKVFDSSMYYLRFLSEMTLTLGDGKPRKATGITEFVAPKALKHRWLNRLNDLRTGRNGKGPRL